LRRKEIQEFAQSAYSIELFVRDPDTKLLLERCDHFQMSEGIHPYGVHQIIVDPEGVRRFTNAAGDHGADE
jgi:hypothetical protein